MAASSVALWQVLALASHFRLQTQWVENEVTSFRSCSACCQRRCDAMSFLEVGRAIQSINAAAANGWAHCANSKMRACSFCPYTTTSATAMRMQKRHGIAPAPLARIKEKASEAQVLKTRCHAYASPHTIKLPYRCKTVSCETETAWRAGTWVSIAVSAMSPLWPVIPRGATFEGMQIPWKLHMPHFCRKTVSMMNMHLQRRRASARVARVP